MARLARQSSRGSDAGKIRADPHPSLRYRRNQGATIPAAVHVNRLADESRHLSGGKSGKSLLASNWPLFMVRRTLAREYLAAGKEAFWRDFPWPFTARPLHALERCRMWPRRQQFLCYSAHDVTHSLDASFYSKHTGLTNRPKPTFLIGTSSSCMAAAVNMQITSAPRVSDTRMTCIEPTQVA